MTTKGSISELTNSEKTEISLLFLEIFSVQKKPLYAIKILFKRKPEKMDKLDRKITDFTEWAKGPILNLFEIFSRLLLFKNINDLEKLNFS